MSPILKPNRAFSAKVNRDYGTGWLPPIYDRRDYTTDHPKIKSLSKKLKIPKKKLKSALPNSVDLRSFCSPIVDQMSLGSCTANAAVGIVEYYQRRAFSKYIVGSRLFVYKNTRNLMGVTGDTGAWLRITTGALALSGVPAAKFWPYTDAHPTFDEDPTPFVYSVADNYEAISYFCHDPLAKNTPYKDVLASVKAYLASGIPSMFGFWGFHSSDYGDVPGAFPLPHAMENIEWGHAVVAVGYDDSIEISNTLYPEIVTKGALLIRNSWGVAWGDQGYGWIPYDYVLYNLAMDFWSLLSMEWVDTDQFHFDS